MKLQKSEYGRGNEVGQCLFFFESNIPALPWYDKGETCQDGRLLGSNKDLSNVKPMLYQRSNSTLTKKDYYRMKVNTSCFKGVGPKKDRFIM